LVGEFPGIELVVSTLISEADYITRFIHAYQQVGPAPGIASYQYCLPTTQWAFWKLTFKEAFDLSEFLWIYCASI